MNHIFGFAFAVFLGFANASPSLAQWVRTSEPSGKVNRVFVSGSNLYAATYSDGVFLSTDNGTSWISLGLKGSVIYSFSASGSELFAGSWQGCFRYANRDTSWIAMDTGLTNTNVLSVATDGTYLFAGTFRGGIFRSTDHGGSWSETNVGLADSVVYALAVVPNTMGGMDVFAGTEGGVFLSTDNGMSWTAVNTGLTWKIINVLAVSNTNLFAGTDQLGVFLSSDNGTEWITIGPPQASKYIKVLGLAVADTILFSGTSGGVVMITNGGSNWRDVTSGLPSPFVDAVAISDTYLFAAIEDSGVWRRPLSELTTLKASSTPLPTQFGLGQNYPNPFNPSTTINYQLPTNSFVSLKVLDVLGREVKSLVNERQTAGSHSVTFDGSQLPSGVYFYRLQAGNYVETKKLVLLK